jgi:hypothetical protein
MSTQEQKLALIVGNGPSRRDVDLNELAGRIPIYGCNALYRDFDGWDYLFSIDHGMVDELNQSLTNYKGQVIIPPIEMHFEDEAYSQVRRRNNTGMIAMDYAIQHGRNMMLCLGFDFLFTDPEASVGNMYAGTTNYGPMTAALPADNKYRLKYLEWFAGTKHPTKAFIFVAPDGSQLTRVDAPNVGYMAMTDFLKQTAK